MAVTRTPTMNARRYADAISHHSLRVRWERANRCTCWDMSYSEQPKADCKACGGSGYLYLPGIEERDGIFLTGLVLTKEFNGAGDWKTGDLIGTIPFEVRRQPAPTRMYYEPNPLFPVGEWDRFTLLDALFRSHETLIMGQARPGIPVETLRYSCVALSDDPAKVGEPMVDYVLQADPDTGAVTFYEMYTDYTVTGNKISWLDGHGPAPGTQYSVTYWHNPIYVVYTQLPQSRDGLEGKHMPRKVVLRYRDDM